MNMSRGKIVVPRMLISDRFVAHCDAELRAANSEDNALSVSRPPTPATAKVQTCHELPPGSTSFSLKSVRGCMREIWAGTCSISKQEERPQRSQECRLEPSGQRGTRAFLGAP